MAPHQKPAAAGAGEAEGNQAPVFRAEAAQGTEGICPGREQGDRVRLSLL